jgi:hypothetical protein
MNNVSVCFNYTVPTFVVYPHEFVNCFLDMAKRVKGRWPKTYTVPSLCRFAKAYNT